MALNLVRGSFNVHLKKKAPCQITPCTTAGIQEGCGSHEQWPVVAAVLGTSGVTGVQTVVI